MRLYRITDPVPSYPEFLRLVRKQKLVWPDILGSDALALTREEKNGSAWKLGWFDSTA